MVYNCEKDGNVGANYYLAILYIDGIKNYLTPDLDKALELLNDVLENQIPETYALKGEIFLKRICGMRQRNGLQSLPS